MYRSTYDAVEPLVVSGVVDDEWFDGRVIDADNIYLTATHDYYYVVDTAPAYVSAIETNVDANTSENKDKTGAPGVAGSPELEDGTYISTRGEVTKISGRELTVESNGQTMKVDTADMMYNPLDKAYGEPIEKGDRVYVYGEVDDDFFSKKEISANSVVKLRDASEQS